MASRSKVKSLIQQAIVTFSKKRGHGLDEGFAEELDKLKKLVCYINKISAIRIYSQIVVGHGNLCSMIRNGNVKIDGDSI